MNCQLKNELSRSTCTMYDYHKALSACRSAAQTSQQHSVVPSVAKKRRLTRSDNRLQRTERYLSGRSACCILVFSQEVARCAEVEVVRYAQYSRAVVQWSVVMKRKLNPAASAIHYTTRITQLQPSTDQGIACMADRRRFASTFPFRR